MIQLLLAIIYLAFISLGLPDSLLGAAWPSMYPSFDVPVSFAGIVSMIIAVGTIVSSLQSDRLTRVFGAGKVTAVSVALTAFALFGFSLSHSFWPLCLWAIPYGLGAGSVDAALNNYVALHFASRHMSWLHCMWGVGASIGPYIMGWALTGGQGWNAGYRCVALIQLVLTILLLVSLPLWKKGRSAGQDPSVLQSGPLSLRQVFSIPGARQTMITFFCYCALEQTASLWSGSYFAIQRGANAEEAARLAGLFFLGITAGRAAAGFLTFFLNDVKTVRWGQLLSLAGILLLLVPDGVPLAGISLILVGLGCAPIFPSMMHATPSRFGAERSQAIVGIQMASAYAGTCLMPPVFGLLAQAAGIFLFPGFLLLMLALMAVTHERTIRITTHRKHLSDAPS